MRGQRIQLTTDITALGTRHHTGDQGTVDSYDAREEQLTVRMDDGRPNFPHTDEVIFLPQPGQ